MKTYYIVLPAASWQFNKFWRRILFSQAAKKLIWLKWFLYLSCFDFLNQIFFFELANSYNNGIVRQRCSNKITCDLLPKKVYEISFFYLVFVIKFRKFNLKVFHLMENFLPFSSCYMVLVVYSFNHSDWLSYILFSIKLPRFCAVLKIYCVSGRWMAIEFEIGN